MNELPLVGAAMTADYLPHYVDWLIADQRDLEIQDFIDLDLLDSGDWKARVKDIRSRLDGYQGRMGIHPPFWNLDAAAIDPKIRQVVSDRYKQSLEVCAELGATHCVIHSPLKFLGHAHSLKAPSIMGTPLFDIIHQTMADVVPMAESIGCTLVFENIFDLYPLMLTDLVASFESDYVRQSLDTGHAYINYALYDAPPPDYWVREAGAMMAHIHLQDTDGYADRHWSISEGNINWHALFKAIRSLDEQPRLILELMNYDDIARSAEWLKVQRLAR